MSEFQPVLRMLDRETNDPTQPPRSLTGVIFILFCIWALGVVCGVAWIYQTRVVLPRETKLYVRP